MISLNKLPPNTKKLFETLVAHNKDGLMDDLLLIGGTALAMQIEHRMSEDLDFAVGTLRLPTEKIATLIQRLERAGMVVLDTTNEAARDEYENDGLEIENYQQDWLVDGTKLTFFTYGKNEHEQRTIIESSFDKFQGIRIASVDTIAKTKSHTLTRRTKTRDLFDIYHLIKTGDLSIDKVIAEMQESNPHMLYETCIHRLVEKPIQSDDEGLKPIGVDIPIADIREFLLQKVEELESNMAREILEQFKAKPADENKQYIGKIERNNGGGIVIQSIGREEYVAHQKDRVGNLEMGTIYTITYHGPDKPVQVVPEPKKEITL